MAYVVPTTRSSGDPGQVSDYNILCNNDIEIESRKDTSYVEFTADVSITATVEASATTIVTAAAVSANGTDVYEIEFYCPSLDLVGNAGGNSCIVSIFDSGTQIGRIATRTSAGTTTESDEVSVKRRLVPTNGSHTYSVRAHRTNANCTMNAGAGGVGTDFPGFIRVRKVQ